MPIETRDAQKTSAAPRRTRDTIAPPHLDRLPDWQLERRSLSLAPDAEFEPIDDRVAATSLWARLHDMIDRYPGHCAVRSHDRAITFEQLGGICARAAHGLSSRIAPHAIIGLYFDFEVEAYAAVATSILAGHPFVFIDAALPDARVRYLVDDAGVELVLTCDRLAFRAMAAATTAPVVTIEESAAGGSAAYTGVERGPDDLACLTYTSGTTGDPCGAIRSDGSFLAGLSWSINALGINSRDVTVITSFGTAASTAYMVTGMLTGSGVLLHNVRRHGISRLAARLREERATLLYMPSHLLRVFSRTLPGGSRFPDLRIVRSHADSCLPSDVERFYECFARHTTLVNGLANSEAMSISIYFTSADDRYDDGRVPVGYPIGDVDVRIEDARGNRVDCGTPGEIVVSGRCIAPGYHGGREAATGKIAADPGRPDRYRLHTGDLGYQLDDGQLVHAGRLGSWTKVRGYRVQLEEIARAVRDLPGVDDVHLRVSTLESGHEGIVAYVASAGAAALGATDPRSLLAARLPEHMVPSCFIELDRIPLRNNGKVDVSALPAPGGARRRSGDAPATTRERAMADYWTRCLGVADIGRDEDFFDLGGSSIAALEVLELFRKRFGIVVPVGTFFERRTIAGICGAVDELPPSETYDYLLPIRLGGSRPPVYCVHGDLNDVAKHLPAAQPLHVLWPIGIRGERAEIAMPDVLARYLHELEPAIAGRPYILAGYSIGGVIAWELTRELERRGQPPAWLILIDSTPPVRAAVDSEVRRRNRQACLDHLDRGDPVPEEMRTFYFLDCASQAVRSLDLGGVDTPVIYLRSDIRRDQDTGYWETRAAGGFEKHIVGGDHHSLLNDPHAKRVASVIDRLQRKITQTSSPN